MKVFEKLKCNLGNATPLQKAAIGALTTIIVLMPILVEAPEPHSSALVAKQTTVTITAEEAAKLVRSAAVTQGKAVPIAPDKDCNARLNAIGSDVHILAETGVDSAVFTYGPASIASLPSLNGISKAFDAACVDTVSESLKSRGFGIEQVEISPAEGTGHLIVSWKTAAASK